MKNMLITCSIVVLMAAGACTTSGTDNPPAPTSSERFTAAFNRDIWNHTPAASEQ